jgi:hypothetical protein
MLQWKLQRETRYGETFAPRPGRHLGAFFIFQLFVLWYLGTYDLCPIAYYHNYPSYSIKVT